MKSETAIIVGFPVNRRVETAIVRRYTDRNNRIRLTDFIIVVCKLTLMYGKYSVWILMTLINSMQES